MNLGQEYLIVIKNRFKSIKELGDKAINQLSESDISWSLNSDSNSVAVIVKHVSGNMVSRWSDFLTTDGEKPNRDREQEFINTITTKQQLYTVWEKGWNTLFSTLNKLNEEDLLKNVYIRSESHTVIDAIERQIAHYSYHVGQIVYIGKQLKSEAWNSLSIPRGKSEDYLREMQGKYKRN